MKKTYVLVFTFVLNWQNHHLIQQSLIHLISSFFPKILFYFIYFILLVIKPLQSHVVDISKSSLAQCV